MQNKKRERNVPLGYFNDYFSNYSELLQSFRSVAMESQRLRDIAYDVFKTLNNLNLNFAIEIFSRSERQS